MTACIASVKEKGHFHHNKSGFLHLLLHIHYYLGHDLEVSQLLSNFYKIHRVPLCERQI